MLNENVCRFLKFDQKKSPENSGDLLPVFFFINVRDDAAWQSILPQ